MAAKKETAKESIAKLDKAIAYKSEALDAAINNTFAEINDIIDEYKRSTDKLSELASKVRGLIELSNSIKESVNLKNSYQNIKDIDGAKTKVPEIVEEMLKLGLEIHDAPECTENSEPESIPTEEDMLPIRALIKSMNKNINMLFEIVDKHNHFNDNVVKSNNMFSQDIAYLKSRVDYLEKILYNINPRFKKKIEKCVNLDFINLDDETPNLLEETNDVFYNTMLDKYKNGIIIRPKNSVKLQTNITDPIWYSSNENIASIDSGGNLSAVKPGYAVIMATSKTQNLLEVTCVWVK